MKQFSLLIFIIILSSPIFSQVYTPSSYPTQKSAPEGKNLSPQEEKQLKHDQWLRMDSLSFYGAGSLFGLVSSADQEEVNTSPTGSLGFNFSSQRINGNLFFSYNGKKNIEMRSIEQFGIAILNPNIAGQAINLSLQARALKKAGFNLSFLAVDNTWQINDSTTIESSPYLVKWGLYLEPFVFPTTRNTVRLILKLNYTHRGIFGDFGNTERVIDNRTIKPKGYNGLDFSTNLVFNNVELFFQLSSHSKKEDIPGFSGPQVFFGINVAGNLIRI